MNAGIHESDLPVMYVTADEPKPLPARGQDEVVGHAFVVVEEVVFDDVRTITETKNELLVTEMRVVLHHVPQNRPVSDVRHGLGKLFRIPDSES
jgi:hypothetical protein